MNTIDVGIIKFEPAANPADAEHLVATVDAIETYVSVSLSLDGLYDIHIEGEFRGGEYPTQQLACVAALGHLIIEAADIVGQAPSTKDDQLNRRAELCKAWLNGIKERLGE